MHLGAFLEDVGEDRLGCLNRRGALGEPLLAGGRVEGQNIVRFDQVILDLICIEVDLGAVRLFDRGAVRIAKSPSAHFLRAADLGVQSVLGIHIGQRVLRGRLQHGARGLVDLGFQLGELGLGLLVFAFEGLRFFQRFLFLGRELVDSFLNALLADRSLFVFVLGLFVFVLFLGLGLGFLLVLVLGYIFIRIFTFFGRIRLVAVNELLVGLGLDGLQACKRLTNAYEIFYV